MTPEEQFNYEREQQALEREPSGFFGPLTDILRRTNYFSATFFDELAKNGFDHFGDALMAGFAEAISPQQRTEFKDVIHRVAPDLNPTATSILGTVGDITLDPLNALSLGSLGATKIFGRGLSEAGLIRYNKEIGDAVEAAGWGEKKAGALIKMAQGITDKVGQVFTRHLIGDTIDKLGPEVIGHVPNADLLPVVLRGHGIPVDEAYAKALATADDVGEMITANHGVGTTEKVFNYLNDLKSSPNVGEKLVTDFGREIADPVTTHFEARGHAILDLADKVKAGTATPLEAESALTLVKRFSSIDPEAVFKFQQRYPEMAALAGKAKELERAAYRAAEETAAKKVAEVAGAEIIDKQIPNLPDHEYFDQGGVKLFGKSVISSRAFDYLSNVTGLSKLKAKIGEIKKVQQFIGAFNRNFKLPEEYLKIRQDLERYLQGTENATLQHGASLFTGLGVKKEAKAARELLGKTGTDIDLEINALQREKTQAATDAWKLANPDKELTPQIAKGLEATVSQAERTAIMEKTVDKYKLKDNPKLFASFSKLMHAMNEINMKNFQASLTEEMSTQFLPQIHEIIKDPELFRIFRQGKGLSHEDFVSQGFKSMEEAIAGGYVPEMDALTLYTNRALSSKEAIAHRDFRDALKITYGVDSIKKLPALIRKDVQFIGDSKMPGHWSEGSKSLLQIYDKVQNLFKKYATSVRPSFGARQYFSNSLQQYLALGPQVMGSLDPRTQMHAAMALMHHYGVFPEASEWLDRSVIQSPLGRNITGREYLAKLQQWGVIRGGSLSGELYERDAAKSLAAAIRSYDWNDPGRSGAKKLLGLVTKYMNIPSYIEDMAHASLFGNALRMGYDDRSATNLVNKTLFDYQHGLSAFGRQIGQRLLPFYSYTNFALPFVTRISAAHPNRIANLDKFIEGFFSAMNSHFSNEHLNPSERAALPGFLLARNNYLESLSPEGQAKFRTFTNFSPLDVMGGLQTDPNGDVDLAKTIQQVGLSMIAPAIKMPLELLFNRNFFKNSAIYGGGRKENIGMQNFNTLLGNMVGLFTAGTGEGGSTLIGLASKYGTEYGTTPEVVQDALKKVIDWEPGIDHRTGKETVYVNPWMMYLLTNLIPSFGQAVRISDQNHSPTDKWLDFMAGVGTLEQNLPRDLQIRIDEQNRALRDMKYQMHSAIREGRMDDYEARVADLEQLIQDIMERRAKLMAFPIRGTQ